MRKKNDSGIPFGWQLLVLGASQFIAKSLHLSQRTVIRLAALLFFGLFYLAIHLLNQRKRPSSGASPRAINEIRNRSKRSRLKRKQEKLDRKTGTMRVKRP
jgi:hypothetical protein